VGETREGKTQALEIVKELRCLPLPIEQAAAYIRDASYPTYKLGHARPLKENQVHCTTAWHMSFTQIETTKLNQDASSLLGLLSFLNPDGVLTDFLKAGKGGLDTERRLLVSDQRRLGEALDELKRVSLISRKGGSTSEERITLPRLVPNVIRKNMPRGRSSALEEIVIQICDSAFPETDYADNKARALKLRFQDQVTGPLFSIDGINPSQLGQVLVRVGKFLRDDRNSQQAVEILKRAVSTLKKAHGGAEHPDTLNAMEDLGGAYNKLGRLTDAEAVRDKLLNIYRGWHGGKHPKTLTAMSNLAVTYWTQGQFEHSVALEEEVLKARIETLGTKDPTTLSAKTNLASTYWSLGRLPESVQLDEEVLQARRELWGANHLKTLRAMTNLALTYHALGRLDKSVELHEAVLKERRELLGPDHPDTLQTMGNLASTYDEQGRWDHAVTLNEEVLKARVRISGQEHPDTLTVKLALASTFWKLGRFGNVVTLEKAVWEGRMKVLGKDHPDTVAAKSNLGMTYQKRGSLGEAVKLQEEVLTTRTRVLGEGHPQTLKAGINLGNSYMKQKIFEKSIGLFEKSYEGLRRLGNERPDTHWALKCLVDAYLKVDGWDELFALRGGLLGKNRSDPSMAEWLLQVTQGEAKS
jgi:tetratricopeptide (TPR) repeat protein